MAIQSKNKTSNSLPAQLSIDLFFIDGMMEQCYLRELLVKKTKWLQSEEFDEWFKYDLILEVIKRYNSDIRQDAADWLYIQDIKNKY